MCRSGVMCSEAVDTYREILLKRTKKLCSQHKLGTVGSLMNPGSTPDRGKSVSEKNGKSGKRNLKTCNLKLLASGLTWACLKSGFQHFGIESQTMGISYLSGQAQVNCAERLLLAMQTPPLWQGLDPQTPGGASWSGLQVKSTLVTLDSSATWLSALRWSGRATPSIRRSSKQPVKPLINRPLTST